jgi:hypothetical protein
MRRSLITTFIICFGLLSSLTSVASANTAGATCKRVNEIVKSGSQKLICSQSNKSLIWVKSVDVTTFSFGPAGRIAYRYVNGKQERLSSAGDWLKRDSRKPQNVDPIRAAAYRSIRGLPVDQQHKNVSFEYIVRPSYPKELATTVKAQSVEFAKRLSPLLDEKVTIKLILLTEKDQGFIDKELPKIIPMQDWQGALGILKDYGTLEKFYSRSGTGGGTASYLPEKGFAYYIGHTSSLAKMNTYWPEIAPHEMTHVMQGIFAKGFGGEFPEGDPKAKWHGHFIEGSANTFGMALGFDQLGWYSDEMDLLLQNNIRAFRKDYPMKSLSDAVTLINEIERRDTQARAELSYAAGQIVWEYFVGKYGAEKFVELLKNVRTTESFDANIKKTINIEKSEFYRGAAEYLLASWKRLS